MRFTIARRVLYVNKMPLKMWPGGTFTAMCNWFQTICFFSKHFINITFIFAHLFFTFIFALHLGQSLSLEDNSPLISVLLYLQLGHVSKCLCIFDDGDLLFAKSLLLVEGWVFLPFKKSSKLGIIKYCKRIFKGNN